MSFAHRSKLVPGPYIRYSVPLYPIPRNPLRRQSCHSCCPFPLPPLVNAGLLNKISDGRYVVHSLSPYGKAFLKFMTTF